MATHEEIAYWVEENVNAPTTYGRIAAELRTHARVVALAIKNGPDWLTKAHLVLRSDWTVSPAFVSNGLGPEEAARRLKKDRYEVEQTADGTYRLLNPPDD